jgi:HTH-type transcriptional regulator / antitoxin HigA
MHKRFSTVFEIICEYHILILTSFLARFNVAYRMRQPIQPPGDAIQAELEKRGWTQSYLAAVMGKHQPEINALIQSKRSITPEIAMALGAAFGNAPEFWMNLEGGYRLSLLEPNTEVERRAKLFSFAPLKDMEKRGWIRPTNSLKEMEKEVCKFFNIPSLDANIKIHANARKPFATESLDPAQVAWCIRGGKLASVMEVEKFKPDTFTDALPEIRKLADFPEKTKYLAKVFAEVGVRLVIVEPLTHSPIDGAAFWLADDAPVIMLSVRFDRIDCLWFTLAHECSHIRHQDAQSVDLDLVGESSATDLEEIEARANKEAAALLIPPEKLKSFIIRVKPFYSKERIIQFAHTMKIHPGIVSGQLQFRKEIGWHANREMLAKVRDHITSTTITDGWGKTVPTI